MVKTRVGGSKLRKKASMRKVRGSSRGSDSVSQPFQCPPVSPNWASVWKAAVASAPPNSGTAEVDEQPQSGPAPPQHLRRKLVRRMHFLERVSASAAAGLAARHSVHKRRRRTQALPNLSALSDALAGVEQEVCHTKHGIYLATGSKRIINSRMATVWQPLCAPMTLMAAGALSSLAQHLLLCVFS